MLKRVVPKLVLGALIVGGVIWVAFFAPWQFGFNQASYQAVFLTNGQVYFGQLAERGKVVTLKDVYYLKAQQSIQPKEGEEAKTDLTLVKLGQEIHGPARDMRINREQILFVEDLKDEGAVVKAITEEKAKQ